MGNEFISTGTGVVLGTFWMMFILAMIVFAIVPIWFIFKKADMPGWYSCIPFYTTWKQFELVFGEGNGWMMFLLLIPLVRVIVALLFSVQLGKCFGKSTLFCVGLMFLPIIFYFLLAFDSSVYEGPREKIIPDIN